MINCDVIRDLMPLYADDLLSQSSRELVETHVASCPECKEILDTMCMPLEPEQAAPDTSYVDAIHTHKRKQRRRTILLCVLTVLACVLGWWIYMETHFYEETPKLVSTDEAAILAEMPALQLSEAELALADPSIQAHILQDVQTSDPVVEIPAEPIAHLLTDVLPDDAKDIATAVFHGRNFSLHFICEDLRINLEYIDADKSGNVDLIRKTIGVIKSDGDTDTAYMLEYTPALDHSQYEKHELKHVWFSFLHMP